MNDMTEQEVISRQAIKLEQLEEENRRLKNGIQLAINHIICIGGPLNDNKLRYSKEQLYTFHRIMEELDY